MAALSPERAALAEACAKRDGLAALIARLRAALEEEGRVLFELYGEEGAAEEALEEAKRTERRRTISVILAEPQPEGPDTNTALERLAGLKRLIGAAEGRKTAIEEELRKQEAACDRLRLRVRDAQAAVIAAEPEALEWLWEYGMRLRGGMEDWLKTCELIGLTRLPNGRWQNWHAINLPGTAPASPLADRWAATLAALDGADVEHPLPLAEG